MFGLAGRAFAGLAVIGLCGVVATARADGTGLTRLAGLPASSTMLDTSPGETFNLVGLQSPDSGSTDNKHVRVSFGVFVPLGNFGGFSSSPGFAITSQFVLAPSKVGDLVGSLGLDYYTISGNATDANGSTIGVSGNAMLLPILLEYQFHVGRSFYIGPGIGWVFESASASASGIGVQGSTSNYAYSIAAGATYRSFFGEVRCIGGQQEDDEGLIVSLGARF